MTSSISKGGAAASIHSDSDQITHQLVGHGRNLKSAVKEHDLEQVSLHANELYRLGKRLTSLHVTLNTEAANPLPIVSLLFKVLKEEGSAMAWNPDHKHQIARAARLYLELACMKAVEQNRSLPVDLRADILATIESLAEFKDDKDFVALHYELDCSRQALNHMNEIEWREVATTLIAVAKLAKEGGFGGAAGLVQMLPAQFQRLCKSWFGTTLAVSWLGGAACSGNSSQTHLDTVCKELAAHLSDYHVALSGVELFAELLHFGPTPLHSRAFSDEELSLVTLASFDGTKSKRFRKPLDQSWRVRLRAVKVVATLLSHSNSQIASQAEALLFERRVAEVHPKVKALLMDLETQPQIAAAWSRLYKRNQDALIQQGVETEKVLEEKKQQLAALKKAQRRAQHSETLLREAHAELTEKEKKLEELKSSFTTQSKLVDRLWEDVDEGRGDRSETEQKDLELLNQRKAIKRLELELTAAQAHLEEQKAESQTLVKSTAEQKTLEIEIRELKAVRDNQHALHQHFVKGLNTVLDEVFSAQPASLQVPANDEVPRSLLCPITGALFEDPVLLPETGRSYSRSAIERHFSDLTKRKQPLFCPVTRAQLTSSQLVKNQSLADSVEEHLSGRFCRSPSGSRIGGGAAGESAQPSSSSTDYQKMSLSDLESLAAKDDPGAQCALAVRLQNQGDVKRSFILLSQSAKSNFSESLYQLGRCYSLGIGTKQNHDLALECYRKADSHPEAQNTLGEYFWMGVFVKQDFGRAFQLFKAAASQESPLALQNLALAYQCGLGVEQNLDQANSYHKKALSCWERLAETGNAEAEYRISRAYLKGYGVKESTDTYRNWIEQAAQKGHELARLVLVTNKKKWNIDNAYADKLQTESLPKIEERASQGDPEAAYMLAAFLFDQSPEAAFRWERKAAEQGYMLCQHNLGWCYANGEGVTKDQTQAVHWYLKAAEQGFAKAQFSLGWCYTNGEGVKQDSVQAVHWYRKAAEQGFASAQFNLGVRYDNGEGVTKDQTQAVHWYLKAAEQGYTDAQFNLGVCYANGEGVTQDWTQAVHWYRKAADQGLASAQCNLGVRYEKGEGVTQDWTQAVHWYRKAAEQGYASAQFSLGLRYDNGEGVTKDQTQAVHWYRKAADQGLASAQCNLGVCYANGEGVTQDWTQAVHWYRKAAEQGYASAQFNLGVRYDNGEGVTKDQTQAVHWYRKAADQGLASAQFNLGVCYANGEGVTQDWTQAVHWYRKAADQGLASAQCNLGVRYEKGEGVTQDWTQAVHWYRKAAEQGYASAQFRLGVRYDNGEGLTQDWIQAVHWYRKAAEQGCARAQNNLGLRYEKGEGVTQDWTQAVHWYRKAAEQGFANAQFKLGLRYEKGEGVTQDFAQSMHWYGKAAEQGDELAQKKKLSVFKQKKRQELHQIMLHCNERSGAEAVDKKAQHNFTIGKQYALGTDGEKQSWKKAREHYLIAAESGLPEAQFELGKCYELGHGMMVKSRSMAKKWYQKAADQGYQEASKALERLSARGSRSPRESGGGAAGSATTNVTWL